MQMDGRMIDQQLQSMVKFVGEFAEVPTSSKLCFAKWISFPWTENTI
jgi:hypothetical protein